MEGNSCGFIHMKTFAGVTHIVKTNRPMPALLRHLGSKMPTAPSNSKQPLMYTTANG
jgi:hypothetical protein